MSNQSLAPILCMPRDIKILEYCLGMIDQAEPCTVIELRDMGKDIIFNSLVQKTTHHHFYKKVISQFATNKTELESIAQQLNNIVQPTLCLVNLTQTEDCDWFVQYLGELRLKHSTNFNSVLFSHLRPVISALEKKEKTIYRSLYPLPPMDKQDFDILLQDFIRRFTFTPSLEQRTILQAWATGHVGLFKSLYLTMKNNPSLTFKNDNLLQIDTVLFRLQSIINEFSSETWQRFMNNSLLPSEQQIFDKFGLKKDNHLGSLLIQLQQKQLSSGIIPDYKIILTNSEYAVFNLLLHSLNQLIDREQIINTLVKNDEANGYSDWALDKLISRLRQKIELHHLPYQLVTKKGQGIVLMGKN